MTTPKQLVANSQNSKLSTGPTSISGKLVASKNSIRHGLLSTRLVIPELESEKEWVAHHREIFESIFPVGGLETKLVERIAINLWRLNRVARYEAEVIRVSQESAIESVAHKRKYASITEELTSKAANPEEAADWAKVASERKRIATSLVSAEESKSFNDTEVRSLLQIAWGHVKTFSNISGEDWPPNRVDFKVWNKGNICQLLEWMAQKDGQNGKQFINNLLKAIDVDLHQSKKYSQETARDLDFYKREHLLPSQPVLEYLCRYESHLHRSFQRDLHELQRIQAARQGNFVQPPAILDIDVATNRSDPDK